MTSIRTRQEADVPRPPRRSTARRPTVNEQFLANEIAQQAVRSQPRGRVRTPAMQKFIARTVLQGGEEIIEDENGVHVGAKLVGIYKPTEWGWESVQVPYTNVPMCFNSGFRVSCGDCGGNCQPDPLSPSPNSCPGRAKFATMRCPMCAQRLPWPA